MPGPGPAPAPVGLRLGSAGLHVLAGVGLVALMGAVLKPILPSEARRERWFRRWEPGMRRRRMTQLWPRALERRSGRSGLARSIGLRVVDAQTGGAVTLSSALRLELFDAAMMGLGEVIWGPRIAAAQEQRRASEAAVRAELAAESPGGTPDEAAVLRALMERASGADPSARWHDGCLGLMTFRLFVPLITIPLTRRRQSLDQLVAGVMVIRSTPSRPSGRR